MFCGAGGTGGYKPCCLLSVGVRGGKASAERQGAQVVGQRWLLDRGGAWHICVPIFQFVDPQWNNFPIRLLVQVFSQQHACICLTTIFKWANNEGQHVCRAIFVVLRHQTTVAFWAKSKGTLPPPLVPYSKGHRVGITPQVFCYATVYTFMPTFFLPHSHHLPQGRPYITLNIFGPNVRLNNIYRTLL